MTDAEKRALQAKRLRDDEAFQSFVAQVRDRQVAVFLNAASSPEDRETAHALIRGLSAIEGELRSAETAFAIEQKTKGQHRGSD